MRIGKTPQYFQVCLREFAILVTKRSAPIFRNFSPQRLCTHRINGTTNVAKIAFLDIRVGYLGSGFAQQLPDAFGSGSGVSSAPNLN